MIDLNNLSEFEGFITWTKQDSGDLRNVTETIKALVEELWAARECIQLLMEQRYEFNVRVDRALQKYQGITK